MTEQEVLLADLIELESAGPQLPGSLNKGLIL
jgi:hypothetical protein